MLLQEKPRKRIFISSQKTKFCGKRRCKSIFPYYPAIGFRWNTNLSVSWDFKKEK